jgi:hypothetical protein|tara:strand:+ start:159 stop:455 length:297 start_codon:yes stop_codon:yes gene_type:complete
MDPNELRLIANPIHLKNEKIKKETKKNKNNTDRKLQEFLNEKYLKVYLSELNFKEIITSIDTYINDILIQRIVNESINNIIDDIIENSTKFDFCLPFD